jgi:hypothetical protein
MKKSLKSLGDDNVQMLKMRTEKLGYHYQYSEICYSNQAGGANNFVKRCCNRLELDTLFGDYDQRWRAGYFVSRIPKRPNDLDYVKYYSMIK